MDSLINRLKNKSKSTKSNDNIIKGFVKLNRRDAHLKWIHTRKKRRLAFNRKKTKDGERSFNQVGWIIELVLPAHFSSRWLRTRCLRRTVRPADPVSLPSNLDRILDSVVLHEFSSSFHARTKWVHGFSMKTKNRKYWKCTKDERRLHLRSYRIDSKW